MEALPTFRYHPDPVATGSVRPNESTPCLACNRIRDYIYVGPAYSEMFHYLSGCLCPWCIADGSAAKQFRATFADTGLMDGVSGQVRDTAGARTPGFEAWQQEEWLTCCGDCAAFLGAAGAPELKQSFPEAIPAVTAYVKENYGLEGEELEEFVSGLSKNDQPTAYVFRCLHCQRHLAYVDQT
ncbi:MAG: CbrC family protein [Bryobacteraceae bacterium]